MIKGTGIDLTELGRIERAYSRFGIRFLKKFLTPGEIESMPSSPLAWLAGRFAAKEAAVKALGTGFANGITATQIEIHNEPNGQPALSFLGAARERADMLGARRMHISITHERAMAAAMVILED